MAKTKADPPGFERYARVGTPDAHFERGHLVEWPSMSEWICRTCEHGDTQRLIEHLAVQLEHTRRQNAACRRLVELLLHEDIVFWVGDRSHWYVDDNGGHDRLLDLDPQICAVLVDIQNAQREQGAEQIGG